MRCPKCGYISFDHLDVCLKCKKDIKVASDALQGGVLNVTAPAFLKMQTESPESQIDESDLFSDDAESADEYVDSDLDILLDEDSIEEDEAELTIEMDADEEGDISADFEISQDDEDDEIAIDLSQDEDEPTVDLGRFEDDFEVEVEPQVSGDQIDDSIESEEKEFEIEMPAELADMSDLAPPVSPEVGENLELSAADSSEDLDSLDISLDGLDFDLESDVPARDTSDVLSLDDIDFSDTISEPGKESKKSSEVMDMDEDLNFDLDLGELTMQDDKA